jgi:pimeloyl-ACP methyl ester carboxylesterase
MKNGTVHVEDRSMDYIAFGGGVKNLVMIPGLSDGLKTVKGLAFPFAWMYRQLAKRFRIYSFSRADRMPDGFTTRDMARDVKLAMATLGIEKASVLGVSLGGMIAQHLAADYPEAVDKLILAVTTARQNETIRSCIADWTELARMRDYKGLVIQTSEAAYSEAYLKKFRLTYPFLGIMPQPKSYDRYLVMSQACVTHDAYGVLDCIQAPTLVIGGEQDQIVGAAGSYELAERIPNSQCVMYPQYGHGAFEEAKNFQTVVLNFLCN